MPLNKENKPNQTIHRRYLKYYHSKLEETEEQWQWKGNSPGLKNMNLITRCHIQDTFFFKGSLSAGDTISVFLTFQIGHKKFKVTRYIILIKKKSDLKLNAGCFKKMLSSVWEIIYEIMILKSLPVHHPCQFNIGIFSKWSP